MRREGGLETALLYSLPRLVSEVTCPQGEESQTLPSPGSTAPGCDPARVRPLPASLASFLSVSLGVWEEHSLNNAFVAFPPWRGSQVTHPLGWRSSCSSECHLLLDGVTEGECDTAGTFRAHRVSVQAQLCQRPHALRAFHSRRPPSPSQLGSLLPTVAEVPTSGSPGLVTGRWMASEGGG